MLQKHRASAIYARTSRWRSCVSRCVELRIYRAVLEGIPAIVLFGPLLFRIARQVEVHEVHYSMVVILAMGIGLFSPPLCYYAACAISRTNRVSRLASYERPGSIGLTVFVLCFLGRSSPFSYARFEIFEVLMHLLKRESECEEAFRHQRADSAALSDGGPPMRVAIQFGNLSRE
jgi:hypothetical protein